jgi:hypothetical protein
MPTQSVPAKTSPQAPSPTRYRGAIWTLLVLAPVIAEVLSGATRLSFLFVLIPEIMVWGGGALLARELVRRWRAGATCLLCLGLALSMAEEIIIQQTSIAPLPFIGANASYGRYAGVNWLYLLFMLGFESVWVVLVPVQVTELIFPDRREQPWLRTRGLIATCVAFPIGSFFAWYGWTQQARPRLHAAPYHPPATLILIGLASIAVLIFAAWLLRGYGHAGQVKTRQPASPWLLGIKAFIFAAAWFELIGLVFVPHSGLAIWIPLAAGCVWALISFILVRYWSAARGWGDIHRYALSFGAILGCMVMSDISSAGWTRVDLIAKFGFQLCALVALLLLAAKVWRSNPADHASCENPAARA